MPFACAFGAFQARIQFHTAGLVDHEQGTTVGLNPAIKKIEHSFLRSELTVEEQIKLLGAPHLDRFGNHYGPGDNRADGEEQDDDFGLPSGLVPDIEQFQLVFRTSSGKEIRY